METQLTTQIIERQKLIYIQLENIYRVKKELVSLELLIRENSQSLTKVGDEPVCQWSVCEGPLTISEALYKKMKLRLKIQRMEQDLERLR